MLQRLDPGSYFGATRHLYDAGGLSIAETAFPAEYDIPPHEHENAFFCFVLDGLGTRSWAGRGGGEGPMSLTLFPSDLPHANHWYGGGGRVMHVEFAGPWLERLRGLTKVLDRPSDFERGAPVWLARRLIAECREQDNVSPLIAEGLVLELLGECSRAQPVSHASDVPRWLLSARYRLHERFAENLSLAEVAAECGVSADHLSRAFRKHFGCTAGDYVRKTRVEYACRRLAESETPLAEIALLAGFTDQSHFTKVFQRHMRVSPKQFRALHR
jgi:AraC family transcriptional regulator